MATHVANVTISYIVSKRTESQSQRDKFQATERKRERGVAGRVKVESKLG